MGFLNKLLRRETEVCRDSPDGPLFVWWREHGESKYFTITKDELFTVLLDLVVGWESNLPYPKWAHKEIVDQLIRYYENDFLGAKKESLGYEYSTKKISFLEWICMGPPPDDCR